MTEIPYYCPDAVQTAQAVSVDYKPEIHCGAFSNGHVCVRLDNPTGSIAHRKQGSGHVTDKTGKESECVAVLSALQCHGTSHCLWIVAL